MALGWQFCRKMNKINYKISHAKEEDILCHLNECNSLFSPSLSTRVNIEAFAKKIILNAVTFEAWDSESLIGLVSAYFNNDFAYINHVAVAPLYLRKGIARKLVENCISFAIKKNVREIKLEVSKSNEKALTLYFSLGFVHDSLSAHSQILKLNLYEFGERL